jgi:aminopeptidase YwaD
MRRSNLIRFAVGLLWVPLFSVLPSAWGKAPLSEKALYARHVNVLASEEMGGRAPGTPGAKKARAYIIAQLRQTGLKPAFGDKYIQPFEINSGIEADIQQLRAVGTDKKPRNLRPGRDFNAVVLSASKSFSGPAVFIGYAISNKSRRHDNFAGMTANALKGKVAVAMRYEPHDETGQSLWTDRPGGWTQSASLTKKSSLALKYGASALLIVNPPKHSKAPLIKVKFAAYGKPDIPVLHISTDALKRILKGASIDADEEIARLNKLAHFGTKSGSEIPGLRLSGRVSVKKHKIPSCNIAVKLPGRGKLAKETILVGAHWDHIGRIEGLKATTRPSYRPGADDNASGSAGVLILARRLADRSENDASKHRRAIVLAWFGAEERGMLGSRHMIANLKDLGLETSQIAAMLNMDMIGRLRSGKLSGWSVDLGNGWEELVRSSTKGSELTLTLRGPGMGLSDHVTFQRRNIPVVGFTTGVHSDLHRPSDTPDKINHAGAIEVLNIVDKLVESLSVRPEPIPYDGPK